METLDVGDGILHVRCLAALQIKPGETIIHVGAGTGYYTAFLATVAGQGGSVIADELHEDLARKAEANLKYYPTISVHCSSGVEGPLPECDVIYVNAGATAPMAAWLDALRPGGRLLFPLTKLHGFGAMLLVTRTMENDLLPGLRFKPLSFTATARAMRRPVRSSLTSSKTAGLETTNGKAACGCQITPPRR